MALIGTVPTIVILLGGVLLLGCVLLTRAWQAAGELIYPPRRAASTDPTSLDLAFESVSLRADDGVTCRGWFISAEPDAPASSTPASPSPKGTVVLSHGYAGDCSPDLIYVPLFRGAGYNVLLFDYRGHGMSDGSFTSLVYYERRDLLAALEFLESRGIEQVGLIGFSMGGAIALATAPLSPLVVGVISDCAFAELSQIIANAAAHRGAPRPLAAIIGWLVEFLAGLRLHANLFAADPIHWVSRISPHPVLIMHGAADQSVPVSEARRLFRAAHEPKDLWIVPHADHRKIEDVAPEEYRQRVIAFFDRAFERARSTLPDEMAVR